MLLDTIHSREDLLAVPEQQLPALCEEIRQFLVQHVSRPGGQLAAPHRLVATPAWPAQGRSRAKTIMCWP